MEEKEVKKKVFYGDEGHRVEVSEEERDTRNAEARFALDLIERAGKLVQPIGSEYLGSAVVHYFHRQNIEGPVYFTACHTNVGKLPSEGLADLGWKNLRAALMKAFNRPEPKTRN